MVRERRKSFFDASKRIAESGAQNVKYWEEQAKHPFKTGMRKRKQSPDLDFKCYIGNKERKKSNKSNRMSTSKNQSNENDTVDEQENELSKFVSPDKIQDFTPKVRLHQLSPGTINCLNDERENQHHHRSKTPIDQNDNRIETEPPRPIQHNNLDEPFQANDTSVSNQNQLKEPLLLQQDEMPINSPNESMAIVHGGDDIQDDEFQDNEIQDDEFQNDEFQNNEFQDVESSNGSNSGRSSVISDQDERAKSQRSGETGENVSNDEEIAFYKAPNEELIPVQSNQSHLEMGRGDFSGALENVSHHNGIEPPKCFIDSPKVSFNAIVQFERATFAVNYFDHRDGNIEHHFLSKFDRVHFPALNTFEGTLWVSQITGRLISQYSLIDRSRIKVLEYGQAVTIEGITVTAIEVPRFPGGALFLFQSLSEKSILHVGDFRLPYELETSAMLECYTIHEIYFDRSILSQLLYQFPTYSDRYRMLMNEVTQFIKDNSGQLYLIAVGAFEIGMEYFIYELSKHCRNIAVYVDLKRREFMTNMEADGESNTVIQNLSRQLVDVSVLAKIHVFNVDEINADFLLKYIRLHNFHRVLGIRPRGHSAVPQTVVEVKNCKILDIANPLIGDTSEYEKFVKLNVHK